jgi:hypothetical protein
VIAFPFAPRQTRLRDWLDRHLSDRIHLTKEAEARLFRAAAYGRWTDDFGLLSESERVGVIKSAAGPFARWRAHRHAMKMRYPWPD